MLVNEIQSTDSMLTKIQKSILNFLKEINFDIESVNFKQLIDGEMMQIVRPAALIDTTTGTTIRHSTSYQLSATINIYLVIHDLRSDADLAFKVSDAVEEIFNVLTYQDFGLSINDGLAPVGYNNVTSFVGQSDLRGLMYQVYELTFKADYTLDILPDDDHKERGYLKSIVLSLHADGSSIANVESDIYLNKSIGGTPYTTSNVRIVGGGGPATKFSVIKSGGTPETVF